MSEIVYRVSDFIAICNQVLDTAFGSVVITGELANFKVSKNKWVYFDLKDEYSSVRFFGTVYQLPGPLEDGMLLTVRGVPQLHPRFGFSLTVQSLQLSGEGTIKKASDLLLARLQKEGLFDEDRKRSLPYPPIKIGLVTSKESAAFADFIKIINLRWVGIEVLLYDVQVQGEKAAEQIEKAIEFFNTHAEMPDVLVLIRGGGSADDLQVFSTEGVTRAVAASRIPTMVAIGHEVDISLAELAADKRASTPSNAAELLVPDKKHVLTTIPKYQEALSQSVQSYIDNRKAIIEKARSDLGQIIQQLLEMSKTNLTHQQVALNLLSPSAILKRGYSIVRQNRVTISSAKKLQSGATEIEFYDGKVIVNLSSKKV